MQSLLTPGWPRRLSILSALIFLYAISGFFILPVILKSVIKSEVNSRINGKLEIGSLTINPFALSLSINDLSCFDQEQNNILSFDKLYINFQSKSLYQWQPNFSIVSLLNPKFRFGRNKDGKFNLSNLIKPVKTTEPIENNKSELPRLVFDKIQISSGSLYYFDQEKNKQFEFELIPFQLNLLDFRTEAGKGSKITLQTSNNEQNEISVDGNFSIAPLKAEGLLKLKLKEPGPVLAYLLDKINISPLQAEIDLETSLNFDSSPENSNFTAETSKFEIKNAVIRDRAEKDLLKFANFSVNLNFDLKEELLRISELKAVDGEVFVRQAQDGKLNFSSLLAPDTSESQATPAKNSLGILVENAKLNNFKLNFESQADKLALSDFDFTLGQYDSKKSALQKADIAASLAGGGRINLSLDGEINPLKLQSEFLLSAVDLQQFSPWLSKSLNISQQSGKLDAEGKIVSDQYLSLDGKLKISDLILNDNSSHELIGWKQAAIDNLKWNSASNQLLIQNTDFINPQLALKINQFGKFTFIESAQKPDPLKSESKPTEIKASEDTGKSAAFSYKIGSIKIEKGKLSFKDESLKPTFKVSFDALNATATGLDSSYKKPLKLNLDSSIDGQAKLTYSGDLAIGSSSLMQNAKLNIKQLNMLSLSPYSIKFVGRPINGGKIDITATSQTKDGNIIGENNIILDRFYLGSEIGGAMIGLPISTALSIMRDSSDRITLNLPVRGNIKSAGMSYRNLLYKSFENLILEAVASPLTILGALYNFDTEELSHVDFEPESYELTASEKTKLDLLRKAMSDKQTLKLEIKTAVAVDTDSSAKVWNDELNELADKRMAAIRDYMLKDGVVKQERLYVTAPELLNSKDLKTIPSRLRITS